MPYARGKRPPRGTGKPPGRPPTARLAAAAVLPAVERGELTPEDAAAAADVSRSTVYALRAKSAAAASSTALVAAVGIPLDRKVFADLVARVPSLPRTQQEALAEALPFVGELLGAVSRALARHPIAAVDVARALRAAQA